MFQMQVQNVRCRNKGEFHKKSIYMMIHQLKPVQNLQFYNAYYKLRNSIRKKF